MFRRFRFLSVVAAALAVCCGLAIGPALSAGASTNTAGGPPYGGAKSATGIAGPRPAVRHAAAGSGTQNFIDFSNLPNGTVVTNQYPGVSFFSTPGNVNYVSDQSEYDTPSFICTGPAGGGINCAADTFLDFSSPVSGLTFDAVGVNDTGQVAEVIIRTASGAVSTVPIIGDAGGYTAQLVDLSAYSDITGIDITDITDGAGIGWTDFSYTQSECAAKYQTTVAEHAGDPDLPQVFTDTVTLAWCKQADGSVQISSGSQAPDVEGSGFSPTGIEIKLFSAVGLTFGVTPAAGPAPVIDNEPGFASATASGLSYYEQLNLGTVLLSLIGGRIVSAAAAPLVPLIRSGRLGLISIQLLRQYGQWVAAFDAYAARNFGLPNWAATWVANLPLSGIKGEVAKLSGQFVTTLANSLAALGRNATLTSVINTLESGIKQIASALTFTATDWTPQIIVKIDNSLTPSVSNGDTYTNIGITVQDPDITTTPAS